MEFINIKQDYCKSKLNPCKCRNDDDFALVIGDMCSRKSCNDIWIKCNKCGHIPNDYEGSCGIGSSRDKVAMNLAIAAATSVWNNQEVKT